MAARTEFRTDAERLRAQAKAFQARAEALKVEALDLLRDSWALEREADNLETIQPARPKLAVAGVKTERDTALLERVAGYLSTVELAASSEVAEHVAITQTRARAALARLEAIGMVVRSGAKRGTRYRLTEETEVPTPIDGSKGATLRVLSSMHPTPKELHDREVVHTTEAPAHADALHVP
jgi:FaeA-like protein